MRITSIQRLPRERAYEVRIDDSLVITLSPDILAPAGLRPGRTSDGQVTLYESHGMAIQDLYVAAKVLELARAQGLGRKVGG